MNIIPVVFITDNNYAIPTSVALQSMIDNANPCYNYDVYVLSKSVSITNINYFKQMAQKNVRVNIINIENNTLQKFDEEGYYVSSTALLKFDIANFLPQYDKVLYLDGDVLILRDISELFKINIEGYYVAAVPDMAAIDACHFEEHLDIRNYFNSGVMLLNTKLIREEELTEKLYEVKKMHPEYQCMDQDVFNDVFSKHILFLPPKFNLMFYNFLIANFSLTRVNEFYNTCYSTFGDMEKDAVVIHLTNEKKPWKYRDAYKSSDWMKYYRKTPFFQNGIEIKYNDELKIVSKFGVFTKIWTPPKTTLNIKNFTLVEKCRSANKVDIKLMGRIILKKKMEGFAIKYYFLGIRYKKVLDTGYFLHKLYTYKDHLCMALDDGGNEAIYKSGELLKKNNREYRGLYKQLQRLKEMKRNFENKKEE